MNAPGIGIDGFNIALSNGTGVATYGIALTETLRTAGHPVTGIFGLDPGDDERMREILFFDRLWRSPPARTPAIRRRERRQLWPAYWPFLRARVLDVPLTERVERAQLAERFPDFTRIASRSRLFDLAHRHFRLYGRFLPLRMADPPAIMHWTYPLPITLLGARNVYTVHDLVPLRLPYTTLDDKTSYRRLVGACVAQGAHICTVSETSRGGILSEFDADPDRVSNCYQTSTMRPPSPESADEDMAAIRGMFSLRAHSYFLFFGAIEPKKNVGRLIEAFLSLDSETPLVIVGGRGWQSEEELRLIPKDDEAETERGRRISERIIRLDHLPSHLLAKLIRLARAVLFPSIFEGFGLPVLEAMMMGTPVLTSNTGALREVAGEAALLVDPYDPHAIAEGLRALDGDGGLRSRLSTAGAPQAAGFSPERYRERLDRMYAAVLNDPAA